MLARRVIAISPDKAFAKRLSIGLKAAGGSVETYPGPDALARGEIHAALLVLHLDGEVADSLPEIAKRLRDDASILVILPKSDLNKTVGAMERTRALAGVLIADTMTTADLAAMATRILHGDVFGLEKLVPWGTRIYSTLVGDYQEKSVCISRISEFAANMGVRRKYREAIEQCVDEMLMNALYDAPVDSDGKQIFAEIPTKTRISLRMEQKAVVQYACNGERFIVSVRDRYGTLDRQTVLHYLHKCLHEEQQIDRKTGGAGLGLYIMSNATTSFLFNVLPGMATECVCAFDITAPKVQLKTFGFFTEKIDAAGRLVAGASKLLPSGASHPVERRTAPAAAGTSKGMIAALAAAIVLLMALIVLVAYPRFMAKPTTSIRITTDPPDAIVEVDGRTRGTAQNGELIIDGLTAGEKYRVTARREGWSPADTIVEPVEGSTAPVSLRLDPKAATVNLDSAPSGAVVLYDGKELGTTPVSVSSLPPGEEVELVFRRLGYRDSVRAVPVPAPGGVALVSAAMEIATEFASVTITSTPEGAQIYQNGELLVGKRTPIKDHLLQGGKDYEFTLKLPGHMPGKVKVTVDEGERNVPVEAKLEPGGALTVRANIDGKVWVVGSRTCRKQDAPMIACPLANGKYTVKVESQRPYTRKEFRVVVDSNEVEREFTFGFVRSRSGWHILHRGHKLSYIAFDEGGRKLKLEEDETGETKVVNVQIVSGKVTKVP